jgi:hypothetical protein
MPVAFIAAPIQLSATSPSGSKGDQDMSTIRKYRVNGFDITDSTEFYFKIGKEDRLLLCSFCVADEGIYYYR